MEKIVRTMRKMAGGLRWLVLAAALTFGSEPLQAQQKAVIEITSKSIHAIVYRLDAAPWQPQKIDVQWSRSVNISLGFELNRYGVFGDDAVRETVTEVARMLKILQMERGLARDAITIVGSSNLAKASDYKELVDRIKARSDRRLIIARADTELFYTMLAVMPKTYMAEALFLDAGSNDTRIGYYIPGGARNLSQLQWQRLNRGSANFAAQIKRSRQPGESFADAARRLGKQMEAELIDGAGKHPGLVNREKGLLSGGTAWALVTLLFPGQAEKKFVAITARDIDDFVRLLRANPGRIPEVDLSRLSTASREQARNEIRTLRNKFTPEDLLAGAEILRAVSNAYRFDNKSMYFIREGNIAWAALFAAGGCREVDVAESTR